MNWRVMMLLTVIAFSSTVCAADFSHLDPKGDWAGHGCDSWSGTRLGGMNGRPMMAAGDTRRSPWTLIADTSGTSTEPGEPSRRYSHKDEMPEYSLHPSFRYEFIYDGGGDQTSMFHSFSPAASFYIPSAGYFCQPEVAGIFEFGRVEGEDASRVGAIGRFNFFLLGNGYLDVGFGVEAGYVASDDVAPTSGSQSGGRIGLSLSVPIVFVEPTVFWANEYYEENTLSELGIRVALLRPTWPVGIVFGLRIQEIGSYSAQSVTIGIGAKF